MVHFVKMQGAGNDYIFIDTAEVMADPGELARTMSDRHYGVGGDGLVLILPSETADACMRMFNADGSEAGMCGNAIRCVAKYLFDRGRTGSELTIQTAAGPRQITLTLDPSGRTATGATVDMGEPAFSAPDIPMTGPQRQVLSEKLDVSGREFVIAAASMGNPHCVVFVPDVAGVPLADWGPSIENHPIFPKRTNVEFVAVPDRIHLEVRVWERGTGETMACGTGACASLATAVMRGYTERRATVRLPGGTLVVDWRDDGRIYLTGPAVEVFDGDWPG